MKKRIIILFSLLCILFIQAELYPQTVEYHDSRGNGYYKQKKYAHAITEWIKALEIDPDNEKIQNKIEKVYEVKREKDLAMEKSKKFLRFARKSLKDDDPETATRYSQSAINNFITAYRKDPNDTDLIILKDRLKRISKQAEIDLERKRLNARKKKQYNEYYANALRLMEEKKFKDAITYWDRMLQVFPEDDIAKKGKRKANLAIQSRLRYEQIRKYMADGVDYFDEKEYVKALGEFQEVIKLDPGNPEAENYIAQIDEKIEEKESQERKRIRAEKFYLSGIQNTEEYNFDAAREDYETVLANIDNYKDTKQRIENLDTLEKEYQEKKRQENLARIDREFKNGLYYFMQGQHKRAVSSFQTTLKLDPGNKNAAKYIRMAKEALDLERQTSVDSDSPYYALVQSLIFSGKKLYDNKEYEASLKQWERILNLFPKNAVATEYLLKCQLQLNPDLYKKYAAEQVAEGKKLLQKKKYRNAYRIFAMIKSISPDYSEIDVLIERSKHKKNRLPVDETAEKNVIKVDPKILQARYERGVSRYSTGKLEQALSDFRFVVVNDPQNLKAIINVNKIESELRLASGQSATKKTGKGLTAKQKSLIRKHYFNGINYYSKNRFPEAIAEWRKVVQIDPNHEKAKNNIRKCLLLMKQ